MAARVVGSGAAQQHQPSCVVHAPPEPDQARSARGQRAKPSQGAVGGGQAALERGQSVHSAERTAADSKLGGVAFSSQQRGGGRQQRSCPQPSVQNGVPSVDSSSTSQQQRGRRSASQSPQVERHRRGHGGIPTLCQRYLYFSSKII